MSNGNTGVKLNTVYPNFWEPAFWLNKIQNDENPINLDFEVEEGLNINTDDWVLLFRKFIHFYFCGEFDLIHDVVDARLGKIRKIKNIPSKNTDMVNGIDLRMREKLKDCWFAILDPFDFSYAPSLGFSLKHEKITKLGEFVHPFEIRSLFSDNFQF